MPSCSFVRGSHHESINEISWGPGVGLKNITGVNHLVSLVLCLYRCNYYMVYGKKLKWGQDILYEVGISWDFCFFSWFICHVKVETSTKTCFFFSRVLVLTCVFSIVMIDSAFFVAHHWPTAHLPRIAKRSILDLTKKRGGVWALNPLPF